jgi:hypothetical protein
MELKVMRGGLHTGDPVEDQRLRIAVEKVTQQPGEYWGEKVLLRHEAEALLEVLEVRRYQWEPIQGLVDFLKRVDPLDPEGWNDQRLGAYITYAQATLDEPRWLTDALEDLDRVGRRACQASGIRLFRTLLLHAAIAYFTTGLPPEEDEHTHATG